MTTARVTRTVVLDDDPTGTQAASDAPVLFGHDAGALIDVLRDDRCVYMQTNSRALDEPTAVALARDIRRAALEAAGQLGVGVRFVLRGDSTLRGHVFAESAVFMEHDAVLLFVPAFPEGGRETKNGSHYLRQGGDLVPVQHTEFARDPVFGYSTSDLVEFTRLRSGRKAVLVRLDEVRAGGTAEAILAAPAGSVVLADAELDTDISLIAQGIEAAWTRRPLVVRSAAPLAAELAGVRSGRYLEPADLGLAGHPLVVCGSHTDGARVQLRCLTDDLGPATVLRSDEALRDPEVTGLRAAAAERRIQRPSGARVIATERDRSDRRATLADGAAVMTSLVTAARALVSDADVVVLKGGITSAEVIRHALGATRARVIGQMQPGVSMWRVVASDGRDVPCIIVPGNMGSPDVLQRAVAACARSGTVT